MNKNTCNTCIHYYQHYTFDQNKIFKVYFGHCTCCKVRSKRPDSKICKNYVYAAPAENPFVTKEFLSKALLDYILNLELLPEICNSQTETVEKDFLK